MLLLFRSVGPRKKAENESRCQACWLKLCLLGYNLEPDLYNKLRARLPIVFHDLLPETLEQISTNSNRGEILQFSKATPLSRPLFEGFGEVQSQPFEASKKASEPGLNSAKATKKATVPAVIERLPNGWSKKAVKRRGKWETFLLTPDQRSLKNQLELKLYIAKSGAVIDANLVNFSMPKRTAKIDKKFGSQAESTPLKVDNKSSDSSTPSTPGSVIKRTYQKKSVIVVPRSSRRDVKLPQKYRDEEEQVTTPLKSPTQIKVQESPPQPGKSKKLSPVSAKVHHFIFPAEVCNQEVEKEVLAEKEHQPTQEELRVAILQETAVVAVKSTPRKSIKELAKMGVGTFSIDEDTAKNLASGRFVKRIKVKRCGHCKNCHKRNCRECIACKDMPKYGGQGQLKQACIYRRCSNPTESLYKTQTKPVAFNHDLKDEDIIEPMETSEPPAPKAPEVPMEAAEPEPEDQEDDNPLNQNDADLMPRIPVPPRSHERPKYAYK